MMRLDLITEHGIHSEDSVLTGAWAAWPVGYSLRWPHFKPHEFRSHDGAESLILDVRLLDGLEELRKLVNAPIHINSGFRSVEWNREIGGEPNSHHTHGRAADITISGFKPDEIARFAERVQVFRNGGIGVYPQKGFVHVDVRPNGPARWRG